MMSRTISPRDRLVRASCFNPAHRVSKTLLYVSVGVPSSTGGGTGTGVGSTSPNEVENIVPKRAGNQGFLSELIVTSR